MHARNILISSPTPLAEWELKHQIQQVLNNKFTGQIQITFLNGRTESLFVQQGVVRNLYVRNHRTPDLNWKAPIVRFGRGTLELEPLPTSALMFRKATLEELTPPRPLPSSTNQLASMISLAEYNPNPTLFHIQWSKAEAFVLVAGGHMPIHRAVLLTPGGAETSCTAFDRVLGWEEYQCTVLTYRGDIKSQAWLEIHLNTLLEWYCQNLFKHYQQLTGVIMVKSILQSLSVLAENKGWNIQTQNQQFRDVSLFSSAEEMGKTYREMLSAIRSRIEPIIGSSLTQYLMKQSTERTTGVYKTIGEIFGLVEDVS